MKKLLLAIVLFATVVVGSLHFAGRAYAASPIDAAKSQVCQGILSQANTTCGQGGSDISKVIKAVVNIISIIAGAAAVIMIIVGGLKYITSNGDSSSVGGAKKTIIYAIIGLAVVAAAQFIVRFVLYNTPK